jgi:hypothetical protein
LCARICFDRQSVDEASPSPQWRIAISIFIASDRQEWLPNAEQSVDVLWDLAAGLDSEFGHPEARSRGELDQGRAYQDCL